MLPMGSVGIGITGSLFRLSFPSIRRLQARRSAMWHSFRAISLKFESQAPLAGHGFPVNCRWCKGPLVRGLQCLIGEVSAPFAGNQSCVRSRARGIDIDFHLHSDRAAYCVPRFAGHCFPNERQRRPRGVAHEVLPDGTESAFSFSSKAMICAQMIWSR